MNTKFKLFSISVTGFECFPNYLCLFKKKADLELNELNTSKWESDRKKNLEHSSN